MTYFLTHLSSKDEAQGELLHNTQDFLQEHRQTREHRDEPQVSRLWIENQWKRAQRFVQIEKCVCDCGLKVELEEIIRILLSNSSSLLLLLGVI